MQILTSIWGVFTTIPYLAFVVAYVLLVIGTKNKRVAVRWSINITNIFLIHAVTLAYGEVWPQSISVWLWICLLLLLIASLLMWLQKQKRGRVHLAKVGLSTWRISFLFFNLAYIWLFGTGIWKLMQIN